MVVDIKTLCVLHRTQVALRETRIALDRAIQIEHALREVMEDTEKPDESCLYLVGEIKMHEDILERYKGVLP